MSESYEFRQATRFTVGAVGEPGSRVFYLQVGDTFDTVSLKLEKQQAQALAEFFSGLLNDLPAPSPEAAAAPFMEPMGPDWTVGQIAVGLDDSGDDNTLVVVVEELVISEELVADDLLSDLEDPEDIERLEQTLESLVGEGEGATVKAHISVDQAAAFIEAAESLVSKGRPPCRLCGQPLDPEGHFCPRLN